MIVSLTMWNLNFFSQNFVLFFFPNWSFFSALNDWNSLSKNKKNPKQFYASSYNSPDFASGLGGHLDMLE